MLEVTQSWTERLQHVVVPIAAQQIRGRASCERIERVRCVAGQQMAMYAVVELRLGKEDEVGKTHLGARVGG